MKVFLDQYDEERIVSKIANADLAQNDPTKPDYVKNRTHWVEEEIELMFEAKDVDIPMPTVEFGNDSGMPHKDFKEGETYIIIWNGNTYECEATRSGLSQLEIGNISVKQGCPDGLESDPPFNFSVFFEEPNNGNTMLTVAFEIGDGNFITEGKVSFAIYKKSEIIHKIDRKFLPDNVVPILNKIVTASSLNHTWDFDTEQADIINSAKSVIFSFMYSGIPSAPIITFGLRNKALNKFDIKFLSAKTMPSTSDATKTVFCVAKFDKVPFSKSLYEYSLYYGIEGGTPTYENTFFLTEGNALIPVTDIVESQLRVDGEIPVGVPVGMVVKCEVIL